jgi:hypothetical protein
MPQPTGIRALAEDLISLYTDAWDRLELAETRLLADWPTLSRAQRRDQLAALQGLVDSLTVTADEQALRWTSDVLPRAYLLGAVAVTAGDLAGLNLDALVIIARDTYADLLAATAGVSDSAKTLIRGLARSQVADKVLTGETAVQAGKDLAAQLEGQGIRAVTYANGTRHGLAEYAEMLLRTKTATAYSTGNLTGISAAGVGWVEVFDGFGCGWIGHNDSDKANGTIRTVEESMTATLSHPRCQRSFGGRPDITSAGAAKDAVASTTAAQRLDQAAVDHSRELAAAQRAVRRALTGTTRSRAGRVVTSAEGQAVTVRQAQRLAGRARARATR